jgi:hypothetical protein
VSALQTTAHLSMRDPGSREMCANADISSLHQQWHMVLNAVLNIIFAVSWNWIVQTLRRAWHSAVAVYGRCQDFFKGWRQQMYFQESTTSITWGRAVFDKDCGWQLWRHCCQRFIRRVKRAELGHVYATHISCGSMHWHYPGWSPNLGPPLVSVSAMIYTVQVRGTEQKICSFKLLFGLRPSPVFIKPTMFWKLVLFPSLGEQDTKQNYCVRPLGRTSLPRGPVL